jgi:hypothetical protein
MVLNGGIHSATGGNSVIINGVANKAIGVAFSTVINGASNEASGVGMSFIASGGLNTASGKYSSILNGLQNT